MTELKRGMIVKLKTGTIEMIVQEPSTWPGFFLCVWQDINGHHCEHPYHPDMLIVVSG